MRKHSQGSAWDKPWLIMYRNGPIPLQARCACKNRRSEASGLILYHPGAVPPDTRPNNLSPLLSVIKSLSRSVWAFWYEAPYNPIIFFVTTCWGTSTIRSSSFTRVIHLSVFRLTAREPDVSKKTTRNLHNVTAYSTLPFKGHSN